MKFSFNFCGMITFFLKSVIHFSNKALVYHSYSPQIKHFEYAGKLDGSAKNRMSNRVSFFLTMQHYTV